MLKYQPNSFKDHHIVIHFKDGNIFHVIGNEIEITETTISVVYNSTRQIVVPVSNIAFVYRDNATLQYEEDILEQELDEDDELDKLNGRI